MHDYKSKLEKGFHYLGIRVIRYRLAILLLTVAVTGLAAVSPLGWLWTIPSTFSIISENTTCGPAISTSP